MNAVATIEEAQRIVRRVVETERGKVGGNVPLGIERASSLYGVDQSILRVLWERRAIKFVKAHILDHLRQIDLWLEARAEREHRSLRDTAETLERTGHPLARLARRAAEMAGEEK